MKFSVLLLYPDYIADEFGKDTYFVHVEANSPARAVDIARAKAAKEHPTYFEGDDGDHAVDFAVLLVVKGHKEDLGFDRDGRRL